MHRANIWKEMEQYRMSRLVICRDFTIFLGDHMAPLLTTDSNLDI